MAYVFPAGSFRKNRLFPLLMLPWGEERRRTVTPKIPEHDEPRTYRDHVRVHVYKHKGCTNMEMLLCKGHPTKTYIKLSLCFFNIHLRYTLSTEGGCVCMCYLSA